MRQGERRQREALRRAHLHLGSEPQRTTDDEAHAPTLNSWLPTRAAKATLSRARPSTARPADRRLRPRREQAPALFAQHLGLAAPTQRHFLHLAHGERSIQVRRRST